MNLFRMRQFVTSDDINAVVSTLESDFLTQGPVVPRFESSISRLTNSKYTVVVNSATSALHLACLALESVLQMLFGPHPLPLPLPLTVLCTVVQKLTL